MHSYFFYQTISQAVWGSWAHMGGAMLKYCSEYKHHRTRREIN